MGHHYRNHSKVYKTPRRPFEKERQDRELRLCGQYGLKSKREVWRVQYTMTKLRKTARTLLTLPENEPRRNLEGAAVMRRMFRYGLLDESKQQLDYVLALKTDDFLERRLQTIVFKLGLAKSVHHARILVRQGHIRVGKQVVNIPSFLVRVDSEKHISFNPRSTLVSGRPGRVKKKKLRNKDE